MTDAADSPPSDGWWLPIAALAATAPLLAVLSLVLPPDPVTMLPAFAVGALALFLSLCSPLFVYLDAQFLAAEIGWTPSNLYYLMAVPLAAPAVAAAYLYDRHRRVGVPANPLATRTRR